MDLLGEQGGLQVNSHPRHLSISVAAAVDVMVSSSSPYCCANCARSRRRASPQYKPSFHRPPFLLFHVVSMLFQQLVALCRKIQVLMKDAAIQVEAHASYIRFLLLHSACRGSALFHRFIVARQSGTCVELSDVVVILCCLRLQGPACRIRAWPDHQLCSLVGHFPPQRSPIHIKADRQTNAAKSVS